MTFAKHLFRGVALSALAVGLTGTATAQDGLNFHVTGNIGDVLYQGAGAGIGSTPGVDVQGYWMGGEDMQGSTFSGLVDGGGIPQFGYQQTGQRLILCVLNNPVRLDLPAVVTAEYDTNGATTAGFSFHNPITLLRPGCDDGTVASGLLNLAPGFDPAREIVSTSAFGMPTGVGPGASFQWIIFGGVPTIAGQGTVPTSVVFMAPNEGLLPSAGSLAVGGTQTLAVITSVTAGISTTGCFALDLDWTVTLGSSIPSADDVNGWWTCLTNARDNNQYWSYSQDHLNVVNAVSAFTSGGATAVFTGLSTNDIEVHSFSADPVSNIALGPMSFVPNGAYYAQPEGQLPFMPNPSGTLNPGHDLGIAPGYTLAGLSGAPTIFSGTDAGATAVFPTGVANAQDPSNAGLTINTLGAATGDTIFNTIGFTTWNNNPYAAPTSSARLLWLQIDWDVTANRIVPGVLPASGPIDPSAQAAATFGAFPGIRLGIRNPVANVGAWPQAFTGKLLDDFLHTPIDRTGDTTWPDPTGFPAGSLGVPAVVGSSAHIPTFAASGACALGGLPVGLSYCSSGLNATANGLNWNPADNRVSIGRSVLLMD